MATAVNSQPASPERERKQNQFSAAATAKQTAKAAAVYRPGDRVPAPGTYWVWHNEHRACHPAKVRFVAFPPCAQCGDQVRFEPADESKSMPTEWLRRDPDFRYALARRRPLKIGMKMKK